MSAKFKAGDMVELLPGTYGGLLRAGMVGTVVEWVGDVDRPIGRIYNSWDVLVNDDHSVINEHFLRLIPGGSESGTAGEWDLCPWSPYREKRAAPAPIF
jgi:hypothetical protein